MRQTLSTNCSCIGMYQLQNLKDIHNGVADCTATPPLYRNVSIAKFEGYTQLVAVSGVGKYVV